MYSHQPPPPQHTHTRTHIWTHGHAKLALARTTRTFDWLIHLEVDPTECWIFLLGKNTQGK